MHASVDAYILKYVCTYYSILTINNKYIITEFLTSVTHVAVAGSQAPSIHDNMIGC